MKTAAKVILAAIGVTALSVLTLKAASAASRPRNLALSSLTFYRPVIARMYSFNTWSLPGETPGSVGAYLAGFAPSFVSGLIRLEAGATLSAQMIADYATVKAAVRTANPGCIFDLWFRPNKYATSAAMATDMQAALSSGLPFDCFSFDNFDSVAPDFQQVAVQNSHAAGKLAMGDVSPSSLGLMAYAPDVISSSDWGFTLPPVLSQLQALGIPLLLHIDNGPQPVDAANMTEHDDWGTIIQDATPVTLVFQAGTITVTLSHQSFLTQMAQAQADNGFAWMSPGFWPGITVTPPTYWNPSPAMRSLMQQLVSAYNLKP